MSIISNIIRRIKNSLRRSVENKALETAEKGIKATVNGVINRCPECHKTIKENDRFCPECGAEIVHICPECGKESPLDIEFCSHCGAKLIS